MIKFIIKLLVVVLIIFGCLGSLYYLKKHKPAIGRAPRPKTAYLVEVKPVEMVSESLIIKTMGTVIPVRQTTIKPRVSGKIVEVSYQFRPGGYYAAGQTIVKIDPSDYELAVAVSKAQLVNAESALAQEMGKQEVARREWEVVSKGREYTEQEKSLALREPQLMQAKANVEVARNNLANNMLDLERTEVKAPYNCIVLTKNVELGANVGTQETLLSVVDIDSFWVEVSIPQDELQWVIVPHMEDSVGSKVAIAYGNDDMIDGTVVSLLSDLESKGRMARALVEVKDPFNLNANSERLPLLLGNYVKADIVGKQLNDVVIVPRTAFRDGNSVWIASGTTDSPILEIRPVKTIWRDENTVIISEGLKAGELLITTAIASPIDGMSLRITGGQNLQ